MGEIKTITVQFNISIFTSFRRSPPPLLLLLFQFFSIELWQICYRDLTNKKDHNEWSRDHTPNLLIQSFIITFLFLSSAQRSMVQP